MYELNNPLLLVNKDNISCNIKNKDKGSLSCLSKNIILKLVKIYNTTFCNNNQKFCLTYKRIKTENRIISDIYKELKNKLTKYNKLYQNEIYWKKIKEFTDIFINDDYIFTPKMPTDWCDSLSEWKNGNTDAPWLSNYDIDEIILSYENKYDNFKFLGSIPIDFKDVKDNMCILDIFNSDSSEKSWLKYNSKKNICNFNPSIYSNKTHFGVVFNTDTHDGSGQHWMSMYICTDKNKPCILFFDSAVTYNPIHNKIQNFINNIKNTYPYLKFKIKYNDHKHQTSNSECGMYSIYFILTMLDADLSSNKNYNAIKFFNKYFDNSDFTIKDKLMILYRTKLFNSSVCKKIQLENSI